MDNDFPFSNRFEVQVFTNGLEEGQTVLLFKVDEEIQSAHHLLNRMSIIIS